MEKLDQQIIEERLADEYGILNRNSFGGKLPKYAIRLSRRAIHTHGSVNFQKREVMISEALFSQHGWEAVRQTLLHEMAHILIHKDGGHARHTKRFWEEFEKRGGVRDRLEVKPKSSYVYACSTCSREIYRSYKIKNPVNYSCLKCDKEYNPDHKLILKRDKGQTSIGDF